MNKQMKIDWPSEDAVELDANGLVKLPKDRFFSPWRIAVGDNTKAIVREAALLITNYEGHYGLRKRARKKTDQITFAAIIEAVLCDMMIAHLDEDDRGSAVSFSKQVLGRRSRYRPTIFSDAMPDIIRRLAASPMDFISLEEGSRQVFGNRGQRSLIRPGPRLLDRMKEHGVQRADVGKHRGEEIIILKAQKLGYWDDGVYQEYDETSETRALRHDLQAVNDWIASADLRFSSPYVLPDRYDLTDRRLRRIFTRGSFRSGGRLFGGFWLGMDKGVRIDGITINGEPVVGLDYGQIAPRIVYGMAGAEPPIGDLYEIDGVAAAYRAGIKKLFNAMFSAEKPLTKKPKETRKELPALPVTTICDLIAKAHPSIATYFYTGVTHHVQYVESSIMMMVLTRLMHEGVVSLPIHDGIVIPEDSAELGAEVMMDVAQEVAGVVIPVSVEQG